MVQMKKLFLIILTLSISLVSSAETIRLKSGVIMNGSILEQTKYTLNLSTKYGVVTLSQKDIVEIMQDKHRVVFKGGGELIGTIDDINEFNLRLITDQGTVNIDVPKIASIEVYDYGQAEKQRAYAEQKQREAEAALNPAAAASAAAPGALSFDSSLSRAFGAKNPTFEEMPVDLVRPAAQPVVTAAPAPVVSAPAATMPKSVSSIVTPASGPKVYSGAVPGDARFNENIGTDREKSLSEKVTSNIVEGKHSKRYLSIGAGAAQMDLKYKDEEDPNAKEMDVGGMAVRIDAKHLWRIGESKLWVGPELGLQSLAKNSFSEGNINTKSNGYSFDIAVAADYFLIEGNKYRSYINASAGFQALRIDFKDSDVTDPDASLPSREVSSNGLLFGAGIGLERRISDLNLGIELKAYNASRTGSLSGSASLFYTAAIHASWRL